MIEKLTLEELTELYKKHIVRDFDKKERRPLFAIKQLHKQGCYTGWGLRENGKWIAYACFIHLSSMNSVLLDYFAVVPQCRGAGQGSAFLKQAIAQWDADGILVESELPERGRTEQDVQTRKRRVEFYERAGAETSEVGWHAFGVDYVLLWLPLQKTGRQVELGEQIQAVYRGIMPGFVVKANTRLFKI